MGHKAPLGLGLAPGTVGREGQLPGRRFVGVGQGAVLAGARGVPRACFVSCQDIPLGYFFEGRSSTKAKYSS